MTVTKQQQLEWLAKHIEKWKSGYTYAVVEKSTDGHLYVRWPSICTSGITKKEWRQERDKMNSKPEVTKSWHERGELPPVGCKCEILGAFGHYQEWFPCKIIAEHSGSVFAANERAWINVKHGEREFRPLRTEREKAIDAACNVICKNGVHDFERLVITKLYDAGMLK